MTGNGRDRIVVLQVGGLHYGGFSAEKALLSVDEEGDRTGADEELVRAFCGMTLSLLWNCRSQTRNWTVRLWDCVLVYSQQHRQNNRAICIMSEVN